MLIGEGGRSEEKGRKLSGKSTRLENRAGLIKGRAIKETSKNQVRLTLVDFHLLFVRLPLAILLDPRRSHATAGFPLFVGRGRGGRGVGGGGLPARGRLHRSSLGGIGELDLSGALLPHVLLVVDFFG